MKKVFCGSSLWELSWGLVLALLLAGGVAVASGKMIACARGQRTLLDMMAILQACRQYDVLHGGWPLSLDALQGLLPEDQFNNVWGYPFMIASNAERIWVETDVPLGVVGRSFKGAHVVVYGVEGKDRVRLSTSRMQGQAARLVYEKRNVYVP